MVETSPFVSSKVRAPLRSEHELCGDSALARLVIDLVSSALDELCWTLRTLVLSKHIGLTPSVPGGGVVPLVASER